MDTGLFPTPDPRVKPARDDVRRSRPAAQDVIHTGLEDFGVRAEQIKVGPGLVGQVRDAMPRRLHAQQGDEIGLAARRVLVGGLAQDVLVALDVQQVVDDLIGQADVVGEAGQGLAVDLAGPGDDQGISKA